VTTALTGQLITPGLQPGRGGIGGAAADHHEVQRGVLGLVAHFLSS
jgi:hypothetical protein